MFNGLGGPGVRHVVGRGLGEEVEVILEEYRRIAFKDARGFWDAAT